MSTEIWCITSFTLLPHLHHGTERLLLLPVRHFECVYNSYTINSIFVVLIWKKLSSTCLQTLPNVRYGYIWRLPKKENMHNILDFQLNVQKYQIISQIWIRAMKLVFTGKIFGKHIILLKKISFKKVCFFYMKFLY